MSLLITLSDPQIIEYLTPSLLFPIRPALSFPVTQVLTSARRF